MTVARSRPRFFEGMQLASADLIAQQDSLDALRHDYGVGLHSNGVAWGLDVQVKDRSLIILPGMAITPTGQCVEFRAPWIVQDSESCTGTHDLFVGLETAPAALDSRSLALGYSRYDAGPKVVFLPRGESIPEDMVYLVSVEFDEHGAILSLDPLARQYCGLSGGSVEICAGASGEACMRLSAAGSADGTKLCIESDTMVCAGLVEVSDGLSVTPPDGGIGAPLAEFEVIGSGDTPLVVMRGPMVSNPSGKSQSVLNSIFDVDAQGRAWIGPDATGSRQARLTVNGQIAMDGDRAIVFGGPGSITWRGGKDQLDLEGGKLEIRSDQDTALQTATKAGRGRLAVNAKGHVGINDPKNDFALSVNGAIGSMKGGFLIGTDKVPQKTAISDGMVMIGTILDWWSFGGKLTFPEEFAICNGKKVEPIKGVQPAIDQTPDLSGYFLLGTVDPHEAGTFGGDAHHHHELSAIPSHAHAIHHSHEFDAESEESHDDVLTTGEWLGAAVHGHAHRVSGALDLPPDSNLTEGTYPDGTAQVTDESRSLPKCVPLVKLMRVR